METTEEKTLPLIESLELTSQRFIPQMADPLQAVEHYHRYLYASRFVRSKRVLDIACGEGYGAAFLSINAEEVVGIDADPMATEQARLKYAKFPNARFETGRCEEFSIPKSSIDVAVTFDTLGLLDSEARHRFVENIKDALKPGGLVLISSPERKARASMENGIDRKYELSAKEFAEFVKQHFKSSIFVGQRSISMSSIWSLYDWKDDHFRFHVREDLFTLPPEDELFAEPTDLIAICSDVQLPREIADNSKSFYYDTAQVKRTTEILSRSQRLEQEVHDLHIEIERVRDEKQQQSALIGRLEANLHEVESGYAQARTELDERDARISTLTNDLASAHSSLETLQQAYDLRTVRATTLKEEHTALTAQVAQLQASLEEQLRISWQSSEENQQYRAQIADLQLRLDERIRTSEAVDAEREKLRLTIDELQQQLRQQANEYAGSNEEIAVLKARITHLENLSEEKSARALKADEELHQAVVHIDGLQHELEEVTAMGARAAEENTKLRLRNNELTEEMAKVSAAAADAQSDRAALVQQIQDLQKRIDEQEAFVRNFAAEQSAMNARLVEAEKVAAERIYQADKAMQELAEARKRVDELEFSNLSVEDQTKDLNDKIKEQTKFLMNLQREYEEQAMIARQSKAELEKQIVAFDTYQKTQSDLQQRYNKSQIKVQELQATITMLEGKLGQITRSGTYKILSNIGFVPKGKK